MRQKERMDFTGKKNVLKFHQIKLLCMPSNSQVNAVYLWNTTSSIWCPWVFMQELRSLLKFITLADCWGDWRTDCLTASTFTGIRMVFDHPGRFFINVDPVAHFESTHLKIMFQLGTLARRRSWKWVWKARWVAITESPFLKTSLWQNHVVHQTTPSHYVSSASIRCAALQLSIFIDLSCRSNWIA